MTQDDTDDTPHTDTRTRAEESRVLSTSTHAGARGFLCVTACGVNHSVCEVSAV